MTDTNLMQVLPPVGVQEKCSWCHIPLSAVPVPPIRYGNHRYHPGCVGAQRAQDLAS